MSQKIRIKLKSRSDSSPYAQAYLYREPFDFRKQEVA